MMRNFGSTRACSSSGRKIHVQPTAIARRQRGCPCSVAPLGKGRKPKILAGKAKKRKRNLAVNILQNCANAKSH